MEGPRQGVHLSPLHLHQWRQLHRLMRWRAFQFRDPDDTYVYRARIEPRPPNEPVTEHKPHNATFPARSASSKRPSSAGGYKTRRPSSTAGNGTVSPSHDTPTRIRPTSSASESARPSSRQTSKSGQNKDITSESPTGKLSGSELTLSASAMSIQPRQSTQRCQTSERTNKQTIVNVATFPYPDPSKVKGNPGFISRLAELARLEADTIRSEQAKVRLMTSRSRPTSARSIKSSVSSASTKSSYQPIASRRPSVSISTSRIPSSMKRLNSSPVVSSSSYRVSNSTSTSATVSKQSLSSGDLQTRLMRPNSELGSVQEGTATSDNSAQEHVQSTNADVHKGQSSSLRCTSGDDAEDSMGDNDEVQRSCSPPIVFIKMPRCSWTIGEGSGDLEKAIPMTEEELKDQDGESLDHEHETFTSKLISEDTGAGKDDTSSGLSLADTNQDLSNNLKESKSVIEDDLKVTSDLGLSIDSLHLSQDDSSEPKAAASPVEDQSANGMEQNTMELECDQFTGNKSTIKSLKIVNSDGISKVNEQDASDSNKPKRARKRASTAKRPNKQLSGSLSSGQDMSSASLTSLKSVKSGSRRTQKHAKKSSKKNVK